MKRLLATDPSSRTAEESLALARFQIQEEERKLARLRQRLAQDPRAKVELDLSSLLLASTQEETTALAALEVMASLHGSQGPDLIYEAWLKARDGSRVRQAAESLLYSRDVYQRASNALRVLLDLRQVKDCGRYADLLSSAERYADRRALSLLRGLEAPRRECGADGKADCHACIRNAQRVRALRAAGQRDAPQL